MSQYGDNRRILRKALEGIVSVLGPVGENAVISELKLKCDYQQDYVDRDIVVDCFQHLFGADSGDLLLQAISKVEDRYQAKVAELAVGG